MLMNGNRTAGWRTLLLWLAMAAPAALPAAAPPDSLPPRPAATLTLDECQRLAQDNYPLVRRYGLLEKARHYDLANAGKGYLPQVTVTGKASYQSDATELPFDLPGIGHIGLPRDQYQVAVEVQQTLWDGGDIRARKQQLEAASQVDVERQRVDMYAVERQVNQLYFSILLLEAQLRQNTLLQDDLTRTYDKIAAYMANGVANQSDLDAVSVEQLDTRQQRVNLEATRDAYLRMLGAFVGRRLQAGVTVLQRPVVQTAAGQGVRGDGMGRPELAWYDAQGRQLDVRQSSLKTGYLPRFGLFVQGAYGNPGLNMLKDGFGAWYMAGVRLSWNFGSLYTLKNDRRSLDNQRRQVEVARDVFLFNTRQEAMQEDANVQSLRRQMQDDDEIIRLRGNIRRAAEAKVANGTLSVADLLTEITRENLARCAKAQHEVQLLLAQYELKHIVND